MGVACSWVESAKIGRRDDFRLLEPWSRDLLHVDVRDPVLRSPPMFEGADFHRCC